MSTSGSGIGSGGGTGQSSVYSVKITGGWFVLQGSRGLDSNSLILGNSSVDCSAISSTSCISAGNVTFTSGPLIVRTSHSNFAAFGQSVISGNPELWIEYLLDSVRESLVGLPIIHIEQLAIPISSIYKLSIAPSDRGTSNFSRSIIINSSRIRGIGFSVPAIGDYSLLYESLSSFETGYLVHHWIYSFSAVAGNDTFYPYAAFVADNDFPPADAPETNPGGIRTAALVGTIGLLFVWYCV
jgi:hypothetical protein